MIDALSGSGLLPGDFSVSVEPVPAAQGDNAAPDRLAGRPLRDVVRRRQRQGLERIGAREDFLGVAGKEVGERAPREAVGQHQPFDGTLERLELRFEVGGVGLAVLRDGLARRVRSPLESSRRPQIQHLRLLLAQDPLPHGELEL